MPHAQPQVPTTTVPLPSGGRMPLLGFGTWQLTGPAAADAVAAALDAGYRHLDTATAYGNEAEVGRAIAESGLPRSEIFITTKLPPEHTERPRETLRESLAQLGVEQVDLWLIHWPPSTGVGEPLWAEFRAAQADGLARDIGVSNYTLAQLDQLAAASAVPPAVNQVAWSPLRHQPEVAAGHRERGIVLEGYSGLRGGVLEHPTVTEIAERLGRTPAQVVIRWHLEHSIVVIPKSAQAERIRSNAAVGDFTLSSADVAALDELAGQPG